MEVNKRNAGIDVLKALSLISVTIYHLYEYKGTYIGVILFFVISGYFITSVLMEREETYCQFIYKRFVKIYPLLTVVLAVVVLIFFWFNKFLTEKMIYSSLSSLFGISNIYQIVGGLSYFERSGDMFPLLHTWTLSIEIQFYLIFPFIIYFIKKINFSNRVNAILLTYFSLLSMGIMYLKSKLGYDLNSLYYGTDTRIFSLLIGGAFYFYFKDRKVDKDRISFLANLSMATIILSILFVDYMLAINYRGLLYILSILSGIVVVATVKGAFLNSDNKLIEILSKLGKRSYSYYLWQYPIMIFFEEYFKWTDVKYSYSVILQIILLIAISEVSYIFLEERVEMAKRIQKIFLFIYLIAIFFLPISEETNSKIIENMINEVNIEMQIKELNTETNEVDNFEKRLLGLNETTEDVKPISPVEQKKIDKKELDKKKEKDTVKTEKIEKVENTQKTKETKVEKIEAAKYIDKAKYTFIGDSVMKGAEPFIKSIFINSNVDAKVSRQFTNLPEILKDLKANKKLNDIVIIHLGTNGVMNKEAFDKSMELLKGRKVYFMNAVVPKFWEESINKNLKDWSKGYENIKLIDWYKKAKGRKELFYKDAIHPNKIGAKLYAEFIYESVR